MGTHRYMLTPACLQRSTNTCRHASRCRHTRERAAYTSPETHANIHVHTLFTHTNTCATPHGAGGRVRMGGQRSPPQLPPHTAIQESHLPTAQTKFSLPFHPQLGLIPGGQGAGAGGFLLEGGVFGHLCECGTGWGPVGPPTWVLLTLADPAQMPWDSGSGWLGTVGSVSPGSRL